MQERILQDWHISVLFIQNPREEKKQNKTKYETHTSNMYTVFFPFPISYKITKSVLENNPKKHNNNFYFIYM